MALKRLLSKTTVLWLDDPACSDPALVGGKAAQLSRLAAVQTVPAGFCLSAPVLTSILAERDPRPSLCDLVGRAYDRLAERVGEAAPRVAVRSSALDEDGQTTSFAGQHETYLNLAGADAILEAVLRCWESGRSERAQTYRRQHGLVLDELQLAVLVQHLVPADVALVAFSANPMNGDREQAVITASFGLGESLVGGTVTPDTWIIDKSSRSILRMDIGAKERMTIATAGGTQEVIVPRVLRGQPSLREDQIHDIVEMLVALERLQGWPVDVECAYALGRLFLLQCRPITSGLAPSG